MLHISIAAEPVFHVLGIPVTNSLITTYLVMALLIVASVAISQSLKRKPGRVQAGAELVIGGLFSFFTNLGGKHGKEYAPIAVTMFLFILTSNWLGLIPGVGTIGFYEGKEEAGTVIEQVKAAAPEPSHIGERDASSSTSVQESGKEIEEEPGVAEAASHETEKKFVPLFRAPTADLNTTLALGIISFILMQYYGFKYGGIGYLKKFINIGNPINTFVGILETVSDISKIISFAFRLFGNVFAGEVLLGVMAFLFAFFLPIPFYALELFVGLIQALVFAMLTTVFINLAVSHGDHEHAEAKAHS